MKQKYLIPDNKKCSEDILKAVKEWKREEGCCDSVICFTLNETTDPERPEIQTMIKGCGYHSAMMLSGVIADQPEVMKLLLTALVMHAKNINQSNSVDAVLDLINNFKMTENEC